MISVPIFMILALDIFIDFVGNRFMQLVNIIKKLNFFSNYNFLLLSDGTGNPSPPVSSSRAGKGKLHFCIFNWILDGKTFLYQYIYGKPYARYIIRCHDLKIDQSIYVHISCRNTR